MQQICSSKAGPVKVKSLKLAMRQAVRAFERSGRTVDAALAYAIAGYPVFPLDPHTKRPIPRRDPDPTGRFPDGIPGTGGHYKATTDQEQIRRWWRKRPWALIGMPMGARTGVWALDADSPIDHPYDGIGNWKTVLKQNGAIRTREHLTSSDGLHLIFNWYAAQPIRGSKGELPKGIEVKGYGGYIAVPPSRRKRRHYLVSRDIDPIDAPAWLIEMILQGRVEPFDDGPTNPFTEYGREPAVVDLDKLADALNWIPNPDDWTEWKNTAMRIYAATNGQGFHLFHAWSQRWEWYTGLEDDQECWRQVSGSPPDRIGASKLFRDCA